MAFYLDEEEIWKCQQHPSKRRRSGVCPVCLKLRLSALCPDCASVRPCSCSAATSSSSSSASSSFSLYFSDAASVGRISTLIDGEPPFRRSRSAAFSFFRSTRFSDDYRKAAPQPERRRKSVWSLLWWQKPKRERMDLEKPKMRRSRSVAASITAENEMRSSPAPAKGKGWYFPSPMKVFRHSKAAKLFQERSPFHRG